MGFRRSSSESRNEELLSRIARELAEQGLDRAGDRVLGRLGESLGGDRCFIAVISRDSRAIRIVHEWCREGARRVQHGDRALPVDDLALLVDGPLRGHPTQIEDLGTLPSDATAERRALEARAVRSVVMVPLQAPAPTEGVVAVETVSAQRHWSESEVSFLMRAAEFLGRCWPRWQEENELRRLALAVEQSPAGVVITDPAGVIEYVNPKFTETSGYTAQEAIGRTTRILRSGETPPEVYQELWRAVRAGEEWRGELANKRKTGELYWEAVSVSGVRAPDGTITHFIGVHEDISERRRARSELEEAKNEADRANRSKSDFLANISHEIRTPVNAVVGMSHLMLNTELTDRQRDYLTKIRTSSQALLATLNAILDFSQIEAGRVAIESLRFEVSDILDEVSEVLAPRAEEKNLRFDVRMTGDPPGALLGDSRRLAQVLTTLGDNAIKFTEHGTVSLSAEVATPRPGVIRLSFAVRDTGIGLSPAEIQRLFQPFTQADTSTTRAFGGTGLGLAIAARVVELMGGRIDIRSEPGHGSEFLVTVEVRRATASIARSVPAPSGIGGVRILLVDDSQTDRKVLSEALGRFAFEVESVASGEAALSLLAKVDSNDRKLFDLALVDWRMPAMDGLETCRRIKQSSHLHNPPSVILITGEGREPPLERLRDGLLDGFLLKPVNPSLLFDAVMAAVGRGPREDGFRRPAISRRPRVTFPDMRVLLVEDNAINQEVAQALLDDLGVEVWIAGNGREAVEIAARSDLDLILMDIQMPIMDGYRATAEIRALPACEKIPIVAMTAHAAAGDRDRCLKAGMDDYISKPIDAARLAEVLRRWTDADEEVAPGDDRADSDDAGSPVLPPDLHGVDIEQALGRVGGNANLLRRLLLEFRHDYGDVVDRLRDALEADATDNLLQQVHTLKGVATTLGLTAVSLVTKELETAAENAEMDRAASLVIALQEALEPVLGALARLEESQESETSTVPVEGPTLEPGDLGPALGTLLELLEQGDVEAGPRLEELGPVLRGVGVEGPLDLLREQILGFDFDEAAFTLGRIAADLGLELGETRS